MKGSIIKRGNKYSIIIDIGKDALGKRKRKWFSGFNSRKEAEKELPKILNKFYAGEIINNNRLTLGAFLQDWLENKNKKDKLSPTTYSGYKNIVYKHLIPTIGGLKLQDLKAFNLQKYFDLKIDELSATTLSNHYRVLSIALIYAEDMELIEKNPLNRVKLPRKTKKEIDVLNIEECKELLNLFEGNINYEIPIALALFCGLRRGEVFGLSWDDIDFKNNLIHIRKNLEFVEGEFFLKEPKTVNSKRTLSAPKSLIELLSNHKKWQLEMILKSGGAWINENNLVCVRPKDGSMVRPQTFSTTFSKMLKARNFKKIRFHDLRHTNATIMLAAGISGKVAQTRLGHSNISITLDLYTHVLKEVDIEAANKIETILAK